MNIDNSFLYKGCPCESGKKFKFCCWPDLRGKIDREMTWSEIVQTVRCEKAGVYNRPEDIANKWPQAYEKAMSLLQEGLVDDARVIFHQARMADVTNWSAWNNEAICAWAKGDLEGAYCIQKEGLERSSFENSFGKASLSIYAYLTGREDEAKVCLDEAVANEKPLSSDVVSRVCEALGLHRLHKDICDYVLKSRFEDDENVAYFHGVALANLGDIENAKRCFIRAAEGKHYVRAGYYLNLIELNKTPYSLRPGEWPYLYSAMFHFVRDVDKEMEEGRDPFRLYPYAAAVGVEILLSDKMRNPSEISEKMKDWKGAQLDGLRELVEHFMEKEIAEFKAAPKGVVVEKDSNLLLFNKGMSLWKFNYFPQNDTEPEDDADCLVETYVRPFADRFCEMDTFNREDEQSVLVCVCFDADKKVRDAPYVKTLNPEGYWDALKESLSHYFEWADENPISCVLRWDQGFGGPILELTDSKGWMEMYSISTSDV